VIGIFPDMRALSLLFALSIVGCEAAPVVMDDAAVSVDALACDQPTRVCVDRDGMPSVGATVTAEAIGETSIVGTTESNGCVVLALTARAWNVSGRSSSGCTSAPTFTSVTGCAFLTVTVDADTCP